MEGKREDGDGLDGLPVVPDVDGLGLVKGFNAWPGVVTFGGANTRLYLVKK